MFGSTIVLDGNGLGDETNRLQGLSQPASKSRRIEGKDADRNSGIHRRESQMLSMEDALPGHISDAH
jgi:hypothetical protein